MAGELKHDFTSPVVDDEIPGEVGPNEWNSPHRVTGGANGQVFVRRSGELYGWRFEDHALSQAFRNLLLRTATGTEGDHRVVLVRADEIVLDDGQRIPGWSNLVADITVSGAGGLDTGTEQNSAWYEIWAIHNSSTQAKALLLHRARAFVADPAIAQAPNVEEPLRSAQSQTKLAQGFRVSQTAKIAYADIMLHRTGSVAVDTNVWLTIEADSGGNPSGTPLVTSHKVQPAFIDGQQGQQVRFVFDEPIELTAGTLYHLVLQGDYAINGSAWVAWSGSSTDVFGDGSLRRFNGSSWSAAGTVADAFLSAGMTRHDTPPTMPSGFDGKCLLGHVFNQGSGNMLGFLQLNRQVIYLEQLNSGNIPQTGWPILISVQDSFPPLPVMGHFQGSHQSDNGVMLVASVYEGYHLRAGSWRRSGGARVVCPGGTMSDPSTGEVVVPVVLQALYVRNEAGGANGRIWYVGYDL